MTEGLKKAAWFLGFAVVFAYGTSIFGGYHFDDGHSVQSNVAVHSLSNIPSFWTDPTTSSMIPENRVYRPLVYTFYAFCWAIGKGSTVPFHLMKMAMHWLVCLSIFSMWSYLWRRPGWWPLREEITVRLLFFRRSILLTQETSALFLASLFAIHPVGSECVDYISSTTSLQCAMFYVLAYVFYLRGRERFRAKWIALSLLFYFLSVASKEEGITLPAMVFITEWLLSAEEKKISRIKRASKIAAPFVGLGLVLAYWVFAFHSPEGDESRGFVSSSHYFMTQWRAYLHYMRLWFWPWGLNADSATWEFSTSIFDSRVIQAAIGNLVILGVAFAKRRVFPALWFGLLWFYVTISPASSVVVLAEAVNERRMYLAYLGFIGGSFTLVLKAAEVMVAPRLREWKIGIFATIVMIGLFLGTQERNRVWRDDESLWKDTVEKNPTSGRAHNNLALVYMARSDFGRAIAHLELCEKHWSNYVYCLLNHGVALDALGKADEAERYLRKAYEVAPKNIHVTFHLGRFLEEKRSKCADAVPLYLSSVHGAGGRYPAADYRAGACLAKLKRWPEAIVAIRRALAVEPENGFGWFSLGTISLEAGMFVEADQAFRRHLALDPRSVQGWYNLAVLKIRVNDFSSAKQALETVVMIDPKSEQGWFNLIYVAEKLGEAQLSLRAARELNRMVPSNATYQKRLKEVEKRFAQISHN